MLNPRNFMRTKSVFVDNSSYLKSSSYYYSSDYELDEDCSFKGSGERK
jgi:hypothetical protein